MIGRLLHRRYTLLADYVQPKTEYLGETGQENPKKSINRKDYAGRNRFDRSMEKIMTGKELVLRTLRHERLERAPWVPFAGVHAGKLTGYSAREILTDADKLVQSLVKVNRIYRPDGQPVVFDLQIEAEALGCELLWPDKTPPSVSTHPLSGRQDIPARIPGPQEARIPFALDAMRKAKVALGETTALYGLVTGPFTLASHLRGTDIFMDMILDPDYVHHLLDYSFAVESAVASYYIDAGMDIIAAVDPLVSQISPDHFKEFLAEPYKKFFDGLRSRGALSSLFVCGNATNNVEPMCLTGPDSISVDENIDLAQAKAITDRYNVCLGGNIQLTVVMLLGTQADNMKAVVDIIDSVPPGNLIVSPGCDMPYDVPIENTIAAGQAARETAQVRSILENYKGARIDLDVVLPDYRNLLKPLVEVFTLDSATCAACGYMMEAAKDMKSIFGEKIDIVEHKFTTKENVARCMKMGVAKLPSIYINGDLKYSSIIPSREDLRGNIAAMLN
jgi:uroporphyrinogen decarboxylase